MIALVGSVWGSEFGVEGVRTGGGEAVGLGVDGVRKIGDEGTKSDGGEAIRVGVRVWGCEGVCESRG